MAQKFSSLDEAAKQLGISKDRLSQIREAGKIRAYRDGASWKFRQDDIDKLVQEGIPSIEPGASDIALNLDAEQEPPSREAGEPSGLDLDMAEELATGPAASDISLEDVDEPTVPATSEAESDVLALDMDESMDLSSESILLSETELGESTDRPPSTIIGRAELDADLDLAPRVKEKAAHLSDVKLAPNSAILPKDDLLPLELEPPSPSANFEGLEEIEVDLEAESSRILTPEDVAKAQAAAKTQRVKAELSDLELLPSDSDLAQPASNLDLGGEITAGSSLTGLSALELEGDEDDQVLGEGSDVTLSSERSGINIISPSDSGLALDEVPLDLSGAAAMGSSLDLGSLEEGEVGLEPLAIGGGAAGSDVGGPFTLTPLGEEAGEEEKDSSQVIALDELTEESGGPLGLGIGRTDDIGEGFAEGLAPSAVVVESASETPFSGWVVAGLTSCLLLLALSGMLAFDLMRNIWSWDGVAPLNSTLLEVLNPLL